MKVIKYINTPANASLTITSPDRSPVPSKEMLEIDWTVDLPNALLKTIWDMDFH